MAVLYIKDADGNKIPIPSIKGEQGNDGTSITISSTSESAEDGGNNTVTFSDGTTLSVKNGSKGSTGDSGNDGYTPVKGTDYWTEDDLTSMQNDNYAYITAELAKRGQLKPEFANSIEECIDTTKLYVLPDGYIYAYIKTKIWQEGSTNLIPTSTVSGGGSIYDGDGYKLGVRLNSSATEKEQPWCITTGFIPITKNDVLRIKYWANGKSDYFTQTGNSICLYNSSYTHLTTNQEGTGLVLNQNGIGAFDSSTEIYTVKISDILDNDDIAFVRISTLVTIVGQTATDADATKVIVTVNEEIADGYYVESYGWASTGHAFVPADYEDKIIELEEELEVQGTRLTSLELNGGNHVPAYWLSELETKADAIQTAMEKAGRNKSAFLWYTDAHWVNGNSKVSPKLLNYLYMNTSMNKVNFGGDIIGDSLLATRDEMKYLYEWRKAIKDLPNHHSVLGNHDIFASEDVDYEGDNFTYSWLIAPEESADMTMGGDFYYYIDNSCEKTRYLYLDSGRRSLSDDETAFVIDALTTTPNGWHVVAISHIWWQYASASTPTTGVINAYCKKMLDLFDAYNARKSGSITMVSATNSYNFTSCGGKFEFCIGGHIHVDYDISSTGGIPVIITTADANQNRVPERTLFWFYLSIYSLMASVTPYSLLLFIIFVAKNILFVHF